MKKLFITLAFVAATFFAQAQFFVGGSLGVGTGSGSTTVKNGDVTVTTDAPKTLDFTFAPSIGYMFNEKMGVGLDLGFGMNKSTEKDEDFTTKVTTTEIGFAPYFRYVFAEVDNFKFYADARIEYAMSKPKAKVEGGGTTVTVDGAKTTTLGVGIVPGMAYMLTDHISMNCALNILELGFATQKTVDKDDDTNYEATTKVNNLGFGVNYATPITIGFFYTF